MITPEEKAQRLRDLYDTFARREVGAIRDFLAADIVWHEPGGDEHAGTYMGPDAVMSGVLARVRQGWSTFAVDLHDVVSNQTHTVALANWTGTSIRSGESHSGHSILVAHIDDVGKLKEVWVIWDNLPHA